MQWHPTLAGTAWDKPADYDALVAAWGTSSGVTITEVGKNEAAGGGDGTKSIYKMVAGTAGKPTVFIGGGIHGAHEWHAPLVIPDFLGWLTTPPHAGLGPLMSLLRTHLQWVSIPCINPHAYAQAWTLNARGVNLNRNFDANWAAYDDSGDVGTKGAAAFSERETQHVRDTLLAYPVVYAVDCHTWGGYSGANLSIHKSQEPHWASVRVQARLMGSLSTALETTEDIHPTLPGWAITQKPRGAQIRAATVEPGSLESAAAIDKYFKAAFIAVGLHALGRL